MFVVVVVVVVVGLSIIFKFGEKWEIIDLMDLRTFAMLPNWLEIAGGETTNDLIDSSSQITLNLKYFDSSRGGNESITI